MSNFSLLSECKDSLLKFSDNSLDPSMKTLIYSWGTPVTAIEVLKVVDLCINGALASDIIVYFMQKVYELALEREKKTHEDMLPLATWREGY
jgi:hypothetical protein